MLCLFNSVYKEIKRRCDNMANPLDNLTHELTVEEARKGGINSGESRRLKKTMKMALIELLQE